MLHKTLRYPAKDHGGALKLRCEAVLDGVHHAAFMGARTQGYVRAEGGGDSKCPPAVHKGHCKLINAAITLTEAL